VDTSDLCYFCLHCYFFSFFVGSVQEEDDVFIVLYAHIMYGWVRPVRYRNAVMQTNLANSPQKPPSASLATGGIRRRKRWPPVGATDRSGGHEWEPDQ